jgi:Thymidylate synthase
VTGAAVYRYGDGSTAYVDILRQLRAGDRVSPRGHACLELTDSMIVIQHPEDAVPLHTNRKMNMAIGAAEYCQLLAGVSSLAQLDLASGGRFTQFSDGGLLRGAYGPKVSHQLTRVTELLSGDPDTRQAVVSVWDHRTSQSAGEVQDTPCTVSMQFRIRRDSLEMTVIMRSSDAWLGIPYDWFMFTRLQMTMAWALSLPCGSFTFFAGSLHLYERDAGKARGIYRNGTGTSAVQPPALTCPPAGTYEAAGMTPASRMGCAQAAARGVVIDRAMPGQSGAADFYRDIVPALPPGHVLCGTCRYITERPDEQPCPACGHA